MGCFIFGGGGRGTGPDMSLVTMEPQFGLRGKTFYDQNSNLRQGTIDNWDGVPFEGSSSGESPDVVNPSLSARYIPGGVYLGKDVNLTPMTGYSGATTVSPRFLSNGLTLPTQGKYCANNLLVRSPRVKTVDVSSLSSSPIVGAAITIDYSDEDDPSNTELPGFVIITYNSTLATGHGYVLWAMTRLLTDNSGVTSTISVVGSAVILADGTRLYSISPIITDIDSTNKTFVLNYGKNVSFPDNNYTYTLIG